jgi:2-iminobutanoate/2-iminopropanoate deaminase
MWHSLVTGVNFIYIMILKKGTMQECKNFNTSKALRMSQVFPQAVIADKFIFLSGTPGFDLNSGQVVSDDFEEQARQCFLNIKIILEEAGSSLNKVIKTTVFMVTGNDFSVLNKVYSDFFPENPPARSTPQVMPFPAGILLSVECIALK